MGIFDLLLTHLKTLFQVREFIKGKLDMQKSFYFMKELGYLVPFNFRWSKLGPYSYELANILDRLTARKYLKYDGKYEIDKRHFRYVKPDATDKMKSFFFEVERISNQKNFSDIDFIECAASLHFIHKNSINKDKEAVFNKLAALKPNRIDSLSPIMEDAWGFLKEQGLLDSKG